MTEIPETGTALDERVAREVFGLTQHDGMWYEETPPSSAHEQHTEEEVGRKLPAYFSDMNAAQEVVKKMDLLGFAIDINPGTKPGHQVVSARKKKFFRVRR